MNDKNQLAAMGEHLSEHHMCLARRVDELEALLREVQPYVKDCADWGGRHSVDLRDAINSALGGVTTTQQATPEGWKLVPVEPTREMREAFHEAHEEWESGDNWSLDSPDHQWRAMLAAAPAPEAK